MLDLDAYFRRIGYRGPAAPSLETLAALMHAHVCAVPFENLDVLLARPIDLSIDAIVEKIVVRRRGGYCFEQNTLFTAVLRALGFAVETLEARVRPPGATAVLPRTHMTLRVRLPGGDRLADVGFGADGPLLPVPFDGTPVVCAGDSHRLAREPGGALVLRRRASEAWSDLYAFLETPAQPVDFVVANHFTSTWPQSTFVRSLTAQRSTLDARHVLRGRSYTCRSGEVSETRELDDTSALALLRNVIGLDVTAEEVRVALADAPG